MYSAALLNDKETKSAGDHLECALWSRYKDGGRSYVGDDMIHVLDIDPRIARLGLHAGRLQAGA